MTFRRTPPPNGTERRATLEEIEEARTHAPIPVRRYGQWIAAAVVAVLVAMLIHALVTDPGFQWSVVGKYLTIKVVLEGVRLTIELTAAAMAIGIGLGVILAVMRVSKNPVIFGVSSAYIWLLRGTPLLVQLIFWFNIATLFPRVSIGFPFGPSFYGVQANHLVTPWMAALLGLGLNEAAYMAEIVRAGLLSVDEGQTEAAQALGMRGGRVLRRIVLPQAIRVIIPPTGNETIGMLKNTSLVSVIGLAELLTTVQLIYQSTFQTVPLLLVAALWYLLMTSILTVGQYYIERHYARGSSRTTRLTFYQRLHNNLLNRRGYDILAPERR